MKKVMNVFCCLLIGCFMVSCNNETVESDSSNDMYVSSEYNETEEEIDFEQVIDAGDLDIDSLYGRAIITNGLQLILREDGTVIGKGINGHGELGNGERTDSEEWSLVEGLEEVEGIYALGNGFGVDWTGYPDRWNGHCYAYTEQGDLYQWGGDLLKPVKIECISNVIEIEQNSPCFFVVRCEGGKNYLVEDYSTQKRTEYDVRPFDSFGKDAQLYSVYGYGARLNTREYVLIDNTNESWCLLDLDGTLDNTYTFSVATESVESRIQDKIDIDTGGRKVTGVIGGGLLEQDDDGENVVLGYGVDATPVYEECTDFVLIARFMNYATEGQFGSLKKAVGISESESWIAYLLFEDGTLISTGRNEDGQLGDGTYLDYNYMDSFLEVDEAKFKDIIYQNYEGERVIALDTENNIWTWGSGFSATPKILVNNDMFLGEITQ